jgi:hypothetical protein
MMPTKKRIKIIKHTQRDDRHAVRLDKRRTSVGNHLDEANRDAVSIVTGWVSELRRKNAQEAAHGFHSLFGKAE